MSILGALFGLFSASSPVLPVAAVAIPPVSPTPTSEPLEAVVSKQEEMPGTSPAAASAAPAFFDQELKKDEKDKRGRW